MTDAPSATFRSSHLSLLAGHKPGDGRIDAIVMPASRPAANLLSAMEVAAMLRRPLVVLCSGRTTTKEAAGLVAEVPGLDCTLIDLHGGWQHEALDFGTGQVPEAMRSRVGDLSTKRNLGLLLAVVAGWRGVLFLDDDIRDLSPRTVREAESALRPGGAVGMIAEDFPDNSVVCHARRLAGTDQGVFVSGSALAVDTTTVDSYFPDVYNEDWLFMHGRIRRRLVSTVGTVRQAPYLPYADLARAEREEFGDVLAEGLMGKLHGGRSKRRAKPEDFWSEAIAQRHRLLDEITGGLSGSDEPDAEAAKAAVQAARDTLLTLDGPVFTDYVRRWHDDLARWRTQVALLPRVGTLPGALDVLGLDDMVARSEDHRRRTLWSRRPRTAPSGAGEPGRTPAWAAGPSQLGRAAASSGAASGQQARGVGLRMPRLSPVRSFRLAER